MGIIKCRRLQLGPLIYSIISIPVASIDVSMVTLLHTRQPLTAIKTCKQSRKTEGDNNVLGLLGIAAFS